MTPKKPQGLLGKVREHVLSFSHFCNWLISKSDCILPPTESRLFWQADWEEGQPRAEGAGTPPSDREKLEGAAEVAQQESPGNSYCRESPPPLPRFPSISGVFRCGRALRLGTADQGPGARSDAAGVKG